MTSLFIIGNGFDIAHGLKTSYDDFRRFLVSNHDEIDFDEFIIPEEYPQRDGGIEYDEGQIISMLMYLINQAESDTEKWRNVESSLGRLDFDEAFDRFEPHLDKEGDLDIFKTSNMYEDIASILAKSTVSIQKYFSEWVHTLDLSAVTAKGSFQQLIGPQDQFLTFNYTDTLEDVYDAPGENVCYIHGRQFEEIFFGHGNKEDKTEVYMGNYIGSQDGLNRIDFALRKKTEDALSKNLHFFENLTRESIKQVYSYGFSFGDVDAIYLQEICERVETADVVWYFNDFDSNEHVRYKDVLRECGYKGRFHTFHID